MVANHGAPEAEQLHRVWTRGRTETESCQRLRSWTVQNISKVSWDECPQALQEGFSVLPIPERLELNSKLCLLQLR